MKRAFSTVHGGGKLGHTGRNHFTAKKPSTTKISSTRLCAPMRDRGLPRSRATSQNPLSGLYYLKCAAAGVTLIGAIVAVAYFTRGPTDRQAVLADCKEYWATLTDDARAVCSRLAND
jgi:hypothetical protein